MKNTKPTFKRAKATDMAHPLFAFCFLLIAFFAFTGCAKQEEPVPTAAPTSAPTETPGETGDPTDTPVPTSTPDPYLHYEYTMTTVFDFATREDKETATVEEDLGWSFGSNNVDFAIVDKKVVCSNIDNVNAVTIRLDKNITERPSSELTDENNAIGVYIENNSDYEMGFCFFGELSVPGASGAHQCVYKDTIFDDIETYLIDENGNLIKGVEYDIASAAYFDCGFAEIPAHFKGYFVVMFESLGHDQCYYAAWGLHDSNTCQDALYRKGSFVYNPGFKIMKEDGDEEDTFVVGEYCYLNIKK